MADADISADSPARPDLTSDLVSTRPIFSMLSWIVPAALLSLSPVQ